MKCANCGFEMPDDAKFCGNCGQKLVVPQPDENPSCPERCILIRASAPLMFILNDKRSTYWKIDSGDWYIDLEDPNCSEVEQSIFGFHFEQPQHLSAISFRQFNTAVYSDYRSMFAGCSGLTELDLSCFNTTMMIVVDSMFENCSSLFRLNLDNWDFENLSSCKRMFWGCDSLRQVSAHGCNARTVSIIAKALAMAGLQEQVILEHD